MSDMFPSDWVEDTLLGGLMSPNEVFWQDLNRMPFFHRTVPMTKAETIMRREEAMAFHRIHTRWPELLLRPWVPSKKQKEMLDREVPESELLYGGTPGGGMTDLDLAWMAGHE